MRGFGYWLADVELREGERGYVHFDVRVINRPMNQSLADVLVPPGREAEARALVDRLQTEVLHPVEPERGPYPDLPSSTRPAPRPARDVPMWIEDQ